MRPLLALLTRSLPRLAISIATVGILAAGFAHSAAAADPRGIWMIENKAAVRIFDCGDRLCGRIVWLDEARDEAGEPKRDRRNPNPDLRERALCGLDVLSGLQGSGSNSWQGGSFYNPLDGHRYDATMRMNSDNEIVARFFVGMPLLGKNRTLRRVSGGEVRESACQLGTVTASSSAPRSPGE